MGFTVLHGATGGSVLRWVAELCQRPSDVPVPFLRGGSALFFLWVTAEVQVPMDGCHCHFYCRSRKADASALASIDGTHGEAGAAEPGSSAQCGERDEVEPKRRRSGAVVSMGGGPAAPATLARWPLRTARACRVA